MIKALIREHQPRCVVIDPLSAIAKAGALGTARAVANRLIYMIKDERVTVMVTSINEGDDPQTESTELQVSAIADTWIHLSYLINGGERNRALTIIKSRGTWHSNQVRELLLDDDGPHLADVYTAGGEVMMGALRWEKERQEHDLGIARRAEFERNRAQLKAAKADTRMRITALQRELEHQAAELKLLATIDEARVASSGDRKSELRRLRNADREPRVSESDKDDAITKPRAGNGAGKSGR
jgi:circadian clock protein KaiC